MTKGGETCDTPVTGTDFYPTILELVGKKQLSKEHQDGVSLVPLLKGERIPERPLIWHYPHYGNQGGEPSSIIRLGDWKLIHYYEDGHQELYNLRTDGGEEHDVSKDNPELVRKLSNQLFRYLEGVGAKYPVKDSEYSREAERQYLEKVEKNRLPQLEQQRLHYLSNDFDPGNNWWGSKILD